MMPDLFVEMGCWLTFCLGWPQSMMLFISTSGVAGINQEIYRIAHVLTAYGKNNSF
jgi:hypothetical protein